MAARPVEVVADTVDVQGVGAGESLKLMGFSVAETASTAAAAEVVLRHGTGSGDPLLVAPINLKADGFGNPWFGDKGVDCQNGIFVDRISGNTALVLYVEGG